MKIAFSLMSAYSRFFSSSINLIAFLCHGALSIIMANFFPSPMGVALMYSLTLSMVVSKVNHSGLHTNSCPVSGRTKPLYETLWFPGSDFTCGALPFLYHAEVIVVWAWKCTSSWYVGIRFGASSNSAIFFGSARGPQSGQNLYWGRSEGESWSIRACGKASGIASCSNLCRIFV